MACTLATDEIWCATLTVGNAGTVGLGCTTNVSGADRCADNLSDDEFNYDSTDYTIERLFLESSGRLHLEWDEDLTAAGEKLKLQVGTQTFNFPSANSRSSTRRRWNGTSLTWTEGDEIRVSLLEPPSASDATLSALTLSGVTLIETFDPATTTYTAEVENAVTQTTVTATTNRTGATVLFQDGTELTNAVTLNEGANTIVVVVTAANGSTTETYTVTVTRKAAVPAPTTCPAGRDWDWNASMTAGVDTSDIGGLTFEVSGFSPSIGVLAPDMFTHGGTPYTVTDIQSSKSLQGTTVTSWILSFSVTGGDLPDGTVVHLGGTVLTVGTGSETGTAGSETWNLQALMIPLEWEEDQVVAACLKFPAAANAQPTFDEGDTATRSVPENSPGGTVVGAPISATDTDGDPLTYYINNPDFAVDSATGQLTVQENANLNFEATSSYTVTVRVGDLKDDDGDTDSSVDDTIDVTVNITDVDEQPGRPKNMMVVPTPGTNDSLTVTWAAPDLNGGPAITGYELEYRKTDTPPRMPYTGNTVSGLTISPLDPGTAYLVRVRALNGETPSLWSEVEGTTGTVVTTTPIVSSVTLTSDPDEDGRTGDDDTYAIDDTIQATVAFSADVTVDTASGTPTLTLNIGGTNKTAIYNSTDSTATELVFDYLVVEGDEATGGIAIDADSLALNGATITAGTTLTHTAVAADPNHKVDGVRPAFVSAETSTDGATITVTFSETISSADRAGFTVLNPVYGPTDATISGTTVTLTLFTALRHDLTVTVSISSNSVTDAAGNGNALADGNPVTNNVEADTAVTGVAITSNPGADANYATGDDIDVTVTFATAMTVDTTDGTPRIQIDLTGIGDTGRRWADYVSGTGTMELVFRYMVAAGDESAAAGIQVDANTLEFNGGTIENASGTAATLAHDKVARDAGHRVNFAHPGLDSAVIPADGATIVLTYDEDLRDGNYSILSRYTLKVDTVTVTPALTGNAVVSGRTVTLTLATPVTAGQAVTLSYDDPDGDQQTGTVEDLARNDAGDFTDETVTNTTITTDTTPPELVSAAVTHSGERIILEFSELELPATEAEAIAFVATLKPEFTVTAGGVTITVDEVNPGTGNSIYLNVSPVIEQGQAVTITYTDPTAGNDAIAIQDAAGNDTLDFTTGLGRVPAVTNNSTVVTSPTVTNVAVTSMPDTDDTYVLRETIEITVTFSAAVRVIGTPDFIFQLDDDLADNATFAKYVRGSGTTDLVFAYTVKSDDMDETGIYVPWDGDIGSPKVIVIGNMESIVAAADTSVIADTSITVRAWRRLYPRHMVDGSQEPMMETGKRGDLRLFPVGGEPHPDGGVKGRVEVFNDGRYKGRYERRYGTVCNDSFDRPGNYAPMLVCKFAMDENGNRLNYEYGEYTGDIKPGGSSQPIWLDDVRCNADGTGRDGSMATKLNQCRHAGWGLHNCKHVEDAHVEDAGVRCWNGNKPALSVSDAEATEASGAELVFTVTLNEPGEEHVIRVDWETWNDTDLTDPTNCKEEDGDLRDDNTECIALAGRDYRVGADHPRSGTLVFAVGESTKTVTLAVVNDDYDEGSETMTLTLRNARGATIGDGEGRGTINDPDTAAQTTEAEPFTAAFEAMPATHDGEEFTFVVRFSDVPQFAVGGALRNHVFDVTGGTILSGAKLLEDGVRNPLARVMTVQPDGTAPVHISLAPAADCEAEDSVCTEDGTPLSSPLAAVVAGPETTTTTVTPTGGLTARFEQMPSEHDGSDFTFVVRFSDVPKSNGRGMYRSHVFDITGGTVFGAAQPVENGVRNRAARIIEVRPDGLAPVRISLPPTTDCDSRRAVCTEAGAALSTPLAAIVKGPAMLIVADAEVREGPNAVLAFRVTLDRAASGAVSVNYATADGTAQAGADYTAVSGTLAFASGETAKTVDVAVLDDSHDEGSETLTLTLSNASGARIADAVATGTIENSDHMPAAWLARFGRTVAEQVVEAAQSRLRSPPRTGAEVRLAGQTLGAAAPDADTAEAQAQAQLDELSRWLRDGSGDDRNRDAGLRTMTARDVLLGSSFALAAETDAGGIAGLWGRGAVSRFSGREDELSLDGEVTSALLGADWTRGPWAAGLMLSHSQGEGSYRGSDTGVVESEVTGLYPYGRHALNDRVTLWGVAGYGTGMLTLTPDGQDAIETDIDLKMGAVGLRAVVAKAPEEGGPELAAVSDAMGVRTTSAAITGDGGNLAAAQADVTRLRLGLEGTWRGLTLGSGELAPRLEAGIRHDGGDAETGFGVDLGGGLAWSDRERGLTAELNTRGLLTHEAGGFRDRGIAGSLSFDPRPDSDRGLSLRLSQTVGASATGGMDALLGRDTLAGLAANDDEDELQRRRLELKLGYGVPAFGGGFTATPELGVGLSDTERRYSLGWRLGLAQDGPGARVTFGLEVEGSRREPVNDDAPEHALALRMRVGWVDGRKPESGPQGVGLKP